MQNGMTPEERLLRLIKGTGKKARIPSAPLRVQKIPLPAVRGTITRFNAEKSLKITNGFLIAIFALLVIYLVFDFIYVKPEQISTIIDAENDADKAVRLSDKKAKTQQEKRDYSRYSRLISGKKVFRAPPAQKKKAGPGDKFKENIFSKLNLVGIITGEDLQAIIEDKRAQKTYYLKKGESFDGFFVEDIADGRVVLNFRGESIVLVL